MPSTIQRIAAGQRYRLGPTVYGRSYWSVDASHIVLQDGHEATVIQCRGYVFMVDDERRTIRCEADLLLKHWELIGSAN